VRSKVPSSGKEAIQTCTFSNGVLLSKSTVDGGHPDGDCALGRFWLSRDRSLLVAAGYFDGYWYYARVFKKVVA
jgi:hypothetical protein